VFVFIFLSHLTSFFVSVYYSNSDTIVTIMKMDGSFLLFWFLFVVFKSTPKLMVMLRFGLFVLYVCVCGFVLSCLGMFFFVHSCNNSETDAFV